LLAFAAGCGPSGGEGHGAHALFGMHRQALPLVGRALRLGMRGARSHGFRRACAEDVTRLCAHSETRRDERECLEQKRDQVSADCKSALDARRKRSETGR
jgi:hypothetical protein